jgi:hypothetical protein
MSCILFNIAIEPLACMVLQSPVRGLKVPKDREKLLTMMYADDTTIFLSKDGDVHTLRRILNKWCQASAAKFNMAKTAILPIGDKNQEA